MNHIKITQAIDALCALIDYPFLHRSTLFRGVDHLIDGKVIKSPKRSSPHLIDYYKCSSVMGAGGIWGSTGSHWFTNMVLVSENF